MLLKNLITGKEREGEEKRERGEREREKERERERGAVGGKRESEERD